MTLSSTSLHLAHACTFHHRLVPGGPGPLDRIGTGVLLCREPTISPQEAHTRG
jgi:hypothetical protein